MSSRRRSNVVISINVNDVQVEGVNDVRDAVFHHFQQHFASSSEPRPGISNLLFKSLTMLDEVELIKPFTMEEIKHAVWECDSFKSPGRDGINVGFVKDFWNILKEDHGCFFNEFHRNGKLTKRLNNTYIALIQKIDCPQRLSDFRPIALVGCLYKIMSMFLANMLRRGFRSVVSES